MQFYNECCTLTSTEYFLIGICWNCSDSGSAKADNASKKLVSPFGNQTLGLVNVTLNVIVTIFLYLTVLGVSSFLYVVYIFSKCSSDMVYP